MYKGINKKIIWENYVWNSGQPWGYIHPQYIRQWYDPTSVVINDNKTLSLKTKFNPRYFPEYNEISDIGIGLVHCEERFSFGKFEFVAKLPRGKYLWPAIWMSGWNAWPPEIDILEGYSNRLSNYFFINWSFPISYWNLKTNLHYIDKDNNDKKDNVGQKSNFFSFKSPSKNYFKYTCIWEKNYIEIFYNKKLVRRFTDKKTLRDLNNKKMMVILNNATLKGVDKTKNHIESVFNIKSFKYEKF